MYGTSSQMLPPAPATTAGVSSMPSISSLLTLCFLERLALTYRDDNQNQRGNANNDDKYVSVAEVSRRDILLNRARLRCHAGGIFVAQLAHRLIHLGIVRTGGLQGFLALFCG